MWNLQARKRLFKMDGKANIYVKKIFNNDLVAIHKNKVASTFNKPA